MRTFLAIKPSAETCLQIDAWRQLSWPLLERPVTPANFHITLAFLGELKPRQLEQVTAAAQDILAAGFELTLTTTGFWSKPGVLWLAPDTSPPALTQLADSCRQIPRRCGLPTDKRDYQPHLTLARRVQPEPVAPIQAPLFVDYYTEFKLYESQRQRHGVHYEELMSWPLLAPPSQHISA